MKHSPVVPANTRGRNLQSRKSRVNREQGIKVNDTSKDDEGTGKPMEHLPRNSAGCRGASPAGRGALTTSPAYRCRMYSSFRSTGALLKDFWYHVSGAPHEPEPGLVAPVHLLGPGATGGRLRIHAVHRHPPFSPPVFLRRAAPSVVPFRWQP